METLFPDTFEIVKGFTTEAQKKPNPAVALEICQLLGVSIAETLFMGDSSVDMHTARNAGMTPVGALWGFRTREELVENGAQYLLSHPLDLLKV